MSDANESKAKLIVKSGIVSIVTNFLLAIFKIIVGLLSNSIAIISDALHGLMDSVSGIVVAITGKITATKTKKEAQKIELIATWIIVIIILVTGAMSLAESVEKIITPEPLEYSLPVGIILVVGVLAKLLLGLYLRCQGKKVKSDALIASSVESLNDALLSGVVIVSIVIYLIWGINIEAYVGAGISIMILCFGASLLRAKEDK